MATSGWECYSYGNLLLEIIQKDLEYEVIDGQANKKYIWQQEC
jgi:hypothetical protein